MLCAYIYSFCLNPVTMRHVPRCIVCIKCSSFIGGNKKYICNLAFTTTLQFDHLYTLKPCVLGPLLQFNHLYPLFSVLLLSVLFIHLNLAFWGHFYKLTWVYSFAVSDVLYRYIETFQFLPWQEIHNHTYTLHWDNSQTEYTCSILHTLDTSTSLHYIFTTRKYTWHISFYNLCWDDVLYV